MKRALRVNRPVWALHVLIVGLALHNLVMAQLWHAGLRGGALSAVSAWKDILLVASLAGSPGRVAADCPHRLRPTGSPWRSPGSSFCTG
jgi:hypothetical protein